MSFKEVVALKETCLCEKEEVRRLKRIVECVTQKAFILHERFVDKHMSNVLTICRRADTFENSAAAIEERLQAVLARSSSLDRQVRKHLERFQNKSGVN